jgi:DNA adenine methylase
MRYVGGKIRQARMITSEINRLRNDRSRYVEPFVGGASVLAQVASSFDDVEASDIVLDLALFWTAVRDGWIPPSTLTRDEYEMLRHAEPSALRCWAGFAASYNGKWWGGYGPTASGRDYLAESVRATIKKSRGIGTVRFYCRHYADTYVDANTVVYADPPYAGTLEYGAAAAFDHDAFWETMEKWTLAGALVLVSEYASPPEWRMINGMTRVETMNHAGPSSGGRKEGLFCHV